MNRGEPEDQNGGLPELLHEPNFSRFVIPSAACNMESSASSYRTVSSCRSTGPKNIASDGMCLARM